MSESEMAKEDWSKCDKQALGETLRELELENSRLREELERAKNELESYRLSVNAVQPLTAHDRTADSQESVGQKGIAPAAAPINESAAAQEQE